MRYFAHEIVSILTADDVCKSTKHRTL